MRRTLLFAAFWVMALLRAPERASPPQQATETLGPFPKRLIVHHPWLSLAVIVASLAFGGAMLVVSGVVPIKASSGHWAITEWFLQFAKHRSVAMHALFVDAPPLDDRALVVRGAGHFELGCRPCHGAPGTGVPKIPAAMTPPPPDLSRRVGGYDAEELFYIVKHGVKFTGMPAWSALQREDEIWAVVAFLRRLPALDSSSYRQLARGDTTTIAELAPMPSRSIDAHDVGIPSTVVEICVRCHGLDGNGRGAGAFPIVGGQHERYLENALQAYARGERFSGIMGPIAAALPEPAIWDVSKYYAESAAAGVLGDVSSAVAPDASAAARGAVIAAQGIPGQDVPPCADCHGPAHPPRNPAYPILSGQNEDYLAQQLRLLQQRRRGGSPYVRLMYPVADKLTADQILDVARYYAGESPESAPFR
jgi:cytochrome c553